MSVTKCIRTKYGKKKTFYRAQVYVRGIRLGDKIFETLAQAATWHDEEKEKLTLDPTRKAKGDMLFRDCLKMFLEDAKRRHKWSSFQSLEARLPYLECQKLGAVKMQELDARAIDDWIRSLLRLPSANCNKRKSFLHELKYLGVILHWYRNYVDAKFVVQITKRHREMVHFKVVKPRRPDYFVRPEHVRDWILWLKDRKKPVYWQLATFMVLTGTRVGEATGFLWDAIDLEEKTAKVFRRVAWDHWTRRPVLEETTKTETSARTLVLPDELVGMLREMKGGLPETAPVFQNHAGELLKYNAIQSAFNAGFVALGLPWRSTHICRHTYATVALLASKDLSSVQASLGHKSYKMTERYAKIVAHLNRGTAEKTARLFDLSGDHTQNHTSGKAETKQDL